jgi:hypothetical protein
MSVEFPVYQIDFSAVAAGKRVAATKRRIRWYVPYRTLPYPTPTVWDGANLGGRIP